MKKKKNDKDKFKEWARAIQYALCLENWRLSYCYFDEPNEKNPEISAEMGTQPIYFEMSLSLYPPFFDSAETHQFEILLHEFCHVLTEELYQTAGAIREGKNLHKEVLEWARERNTTMVQLAATNLMKNTKLQEIYSKLSNIKHHKAPTH